MKLALTTSTYGSVELYEAVRRIRALGYDAIEITGIKGQHIVTDEVGPEKSTPLKAELDKIGLAVSAITSGPCPPLAGEDTLRYVHTSIDLAARLGAKVVITYVTKSPQAEGKKESEWRPDVCERISSLADYAHSKGLRLALETEPGFLVDNPRAGIALVREIGHPFLGYNLCIPHILPTIAPGETVHDVIDLAADLILNTHIADIKNRVHKHLVPGEGEVDFPALFAHLGRIGYKGYFTWDLYPYAQQSDFAAQKVMDFVRQLR